MGAENPQRRQEILDAALHVFSEEGFHKASIKRIAQRAELKSSALIYWYFKDKQELLQSVVMEMMSPLQKLEHFSTLMDEAPKVVLTQIGLSYLASFESDQARKMFRIFLMEAAREPDSMDFMVRSGILKIKEFLTKYLQHQIDLGRLRDHNTEASVRAIMGSFVVYILTRELFPPLREGLPQPAPYIEQVVSFYLDGLLA